MGTRVAASPTRRHGRRWAAVSLTLVALVAISGLVLSLAGCGSGTTAGTGSAVASLPARTVEAGPITVKLEPRQFDAAGAVFKITFDTPLGRARPGPCSPVPPRRGRHPVACCGMVGRWARRTSS